MLNCFNEGFSSDNNEEYQNDDNQKVQVPKVILNYTKAHLEAIQIDELPEQLQSARYQSPIRIESKNEGDEDVGCSRAELRHLSADRSKSGMACYETLDRGCN